MLDCNSVRDVRKNSRYHCYNNKKCDHTINENVVTTAMGVIVVEVAQNDAAMSAKYDFQTPSINKY